MENETKNKKEITWTAPEFVHYPKSPIWYAVFSVIGMAAIAYFFIHRDYLTGTMVILLIAAVIYFGKKKPKTLNITLNENGIKINDSRISYAQVKKFWLIYNPPSVKTLNLETTAYLNRFYTIQLQDQNPVELRQFLRKFVPEDLEADEQFSDKISRALKF